MQNIKSIDGIKKINKLSAASRFPGGRPIRPRIDSVIKRPREAATGTFYVVPNGTASRRLPPSLFLKNILLQKRVPVLVAVFGLLLAFGIGAWSALDTKNISAETQPQAGELSTSTNSSPAVPQGVALTGSQLQSQGAENISAAELFSTPLKYLESYLNASAKPDAISLRKIQIEKFLTDRHSPLAPASETIARQEHWKLILAIAFAESSLGKNCADYNCSNIGIKPGDAAWHSYPSYQAWVVDFNRLLSKRYEDWTLEQMCGVYVKPCNPNWLLATQQILDELKEQGIE